MNRGSAILTNQKGMALILMIGALIAMVILFSQVLAGGLANYSVEANREKTMLAGREVMRDFAQMAQKANEIFEARAGVCPAGTTAAMGRFCWPNANPTFAHCVRHPLAPPGSTARLCLGAATPQRLDYALMPVFERPWLDWAIGRSAELIADFRQMAFEELSSIAEAQNASEGHRPALAAQPSNNLTVLMPCTAATGHSTSCKRCNIAVANFECVELRACLNTVTACAGAANMIRQKIGVTTR